MPSRAGAMKGDGEAGGGSQGGGGDDSGAIGDDDNAARRPSGGRTAGWRSTRHGLTRDPARQATQRRVGAGRAPPVTGQDVFGRAGETGLSRSIRKNWPGIR